MNGIKKVTHADNQIPEVLYHYCSTESFYSIISSSSIWLSALTTSNDSLEGQWIKHVAAAVCEQEGFPSYIRDGILTEFDLLLNFLDGFGLCLSEHDDMLSQWRGYANDGMGVSIGFSTKFFNRVSEALKNDDRPSFSISRIEYNTANQNDLLRPEIAKMKHQIDAGGRNPITPNSLFTLVDDQKNEEYRRKVLSARSNLNLLVLSQLGNAFKLKNPAFSEEREWRLLAVSPKIDRTELQYRPRASGIIPYRVVPISQSPIPAIVSVTTGPKHQPDATYIKGALDYFGFNEVDTRKSSATYR